MTPISNIKTLKEGSLCLSLLAGKKLVHLTDQSLQAPLQDLFPPERITSWPDGDRKLVDRIKPLFDLTPRDLLTREVFKDYSCIESQISGVSPDKTVLEAFGHRLFHTALENPKSPSLILWHRISHDLPISLDDWKPFPKDLKQFHAALSLLKDLKVGGIFTGQSVGSKELSAAQIMEAWKLWGSHFHGLWGLQSKLYQNMTTLAVDILGSKRMRPHQKKSISIFRKFSKGDLQKVFWETPMSFLFKHEVLAICEKKLSFMEKQIALFKGDPHLLQALIFDHLKSINQIVEEISHLAEEMEKTFRKHQENKERKVFPDKSIELKGDSLWLRETHQEAIDSWHDVFLNASILALFSNHLLDVIRKNLTSVLEESKEDQKLFHQLEASYRAKIAYCSLELEDAEFEETAPPKKEDPEDAKQEEIEEVSPLPLDVAPTHTQSSPTVNPLQEQIKEDLMHLEQANPIGSLTPYAETIAEVLEKNMRQSEMGDHLFLMIQGLELLAACKEKECQSAILRSILIDGHIAMEQALKKQAGIPNSQDHNLADLSKMSQIALSEDQKQFFHECPLALYWARYPACSTRYFGNPANRPPMLRLLSEPTSANGPALISFIRHVCKLVIPPDLLSGQWLARVEKLASQSIPLQSEPTLPLFRDLARAIQKATTPLSKETDPEIAEALLHLQELVYYLSWIEQGKKLQKNHPHPSLQFWHQRNELEVDKLFKHLYAADCILHHYGDPRRHRISSLFEILDEIRPLDTATKNFLSSFNLGIAHHYHTLSSPLKSYPHLLKNCRSKVHQFQSAKKDQTAPWSFFDKAMQLFAAQLPFTLKSLSPQQ